MSCLSSTIYKIAKRFTPPAKRMHSTVYQIFTAIENTVLERYMSALRMNTTRRLTQVINVLRTMQTMTTR